MALLKDYNDGIYNITEYTVGGSIRNIITGKLVGKWTNYWTKDETIHHKTKSKLVLIEKELNIKLL